MRRMLLCVSLFLFASITVMPAARAADEPLTVFAAASLKGSLDEIAEAWKQASGVEVRISYAGSSQLARQIESGAPADIFISADLNWMDHLEKASLIDVATRRSLLGNRLVLVTAPQGEAAAVEEIGADYPLVEKLGGGRLSVALIETVPAGRYAKAALQSLGLWDSVSGQLAEAENVRSALAFVARGATPLGIVYATDAAAELGVRVAAVFPEGSHPPIVYPIAVLAGERHARAGEFTDYLGGEAARAVFEQAGFTVLD